MAEEEAEGAVARSGEGGEAATPERPAYAPGSYTTPPGGGAGASASGDAAAGAAGAPAPAPAAADEEDVDAVEARIAELVARRDALRASNDSAVAAAPSEEPAKQHQQHRQVQAERVQVLQVQNFDFSVVADGEFAPGMVAPAAAARKPRGVGAGALAAAATRRPKTASGNRRSARPPSSARPSSASAGQARLGAKRAEATEAGGDENKGTLADHVASAQRRAAEATAAALRAAEDAAREDGTARQEPAAGDDEYAERYPLMSAALASRRQKEGKKERGARKQSGGARGGADEVGVDGLTNAERAVAYSDTMAAFEALEASLLAASERVAASDGDGEGDEGVGAAAADGSTDDVVEMTRRYYDPAREGLAFSGEPEPESEPDAVGGAASVSGVVDGAGARPPPPPVGEDEHMPGADGDGEGSWEKAYEFRDADLIARTRDMAARRRRRPKSADASRSKVRYIGPPPPGTTKVKPFSFDNRDSRPRKTISQMRLEQDLAAAKAREEAELKVRFKAKPIPSSTLLPLYAQLVEASEQRRDEVRRMCKEWLKSVEAPFSFQDRQTKSSAMAKGLAEAPGAVPEGPAFRANPVPAHVKELRYMEMVADDHKRAFVNKALAEAKFRESSLPPRMKAHAQRLKEQEGQEVVVLDPECTFKPHIKHSIPDFNAQHAKFEAALAARRKQLPSTEVQPFTLASKERQAQERIKRDAMLAKARRKAARDEAEAIEHRWPYYSERGAVPKKAMPDFTKLQRSFGEKLNASRADFKPTVLKPFKLGRDQTDREMARSREALAKADAPVFAHQRPTRAEELRLKATREATAEGRFDSAAERDAKEQQRRKLDAKRREEAWAAMQKKKKVEDDSLGLGDGTDAPPPAEGVGAAVDAPAIVPAKPPASSAAEAAAVVDDGHDGESLHRQARHKQVEERAAAIVEQTLLEHGVLDYVEGTGLTPR